MKKNEMEHIIRSVAALTQFQEFVVIGSQSVLGHAGEIPEILLESRELDIYVKDDPQYSDIIDGAVGELSPFDDRFGYYAQGVGAETALLPHLWWYRVNKVQNKNTNDAIAYCLEPHDLAISKLCAGREKDLIFVQHMVNTNFINLDTLEERLNTETIIPALEKIQFNRVKQWITSQKNY